MKKSVAADSGSEDEGGKSAGSGSDSSPAKKKATGLMKPLKLSKELSGLLDLPEDEEMSRPQIVKHLWAYLKKNELQDPENKQWFTPDKRMEPIFGKEKIKCFGMVKYLKGHVE